MKNILASGVILMAAACSPAPVSETAAPAAPSIAPPPAPMAPPQIALQTSLVGRWGITMEACAPENAAKDGVLEITASTVTLGLDTCTISSTTPEGAGTQPPGFIAATAARRPVASFQAAPGRDRVERWL